MALSFSPAAAVAAPAGAASGHSRLPLSPATPSFGFSLRKQTMMIRGTSTLRRAALTEFEPDLQEDPVDKWRTNGVSPEDFKYGEYDGHHTYFEGEEPKRDFWELLAEEYNSAEPPTGFQGIISWLFLPAIAVGMAYNVPGEYLYIGAGAFVVVFCAIEIGKPDQAHNFEPEIYNMERAKRDKLIADYNSMDIWDFNEKYGDLWDFTLKNDDLVKVEK